MEADRITIFASLCEEDKRKINSSMDKIKLSKGKIIFHTGDQADYIYYIVSGSVSISDFFYVAFAGEFFGLEGLFSDDGLHPTEAKTDENTVLLRIPRRVFLQLFTQEQQQASVNGRNANILKMLLRQTNQRLLFNFSKIQAKRGGSAGSIANLLLYYVDTGQVQETNHGLRITKRLTEGLIAECCHCDRSTVSRTLALFNELGVIYKEKRDKYITIVSRERLNDYCLGRMRRNEHA